MSKQSISFNTLKLVLKHLKEKYPHQKSFFSQAAVGKAVDKTKWVIHLYCAGKCEPTNDTADKITKYLQKFEPSIEKEHIFIIKPLNSNK